MGKLQNILYTLKKEANVRSFAHFDRKTMFCLQQEAVTVSSFVLRKDLSQSVVIIPPLWSNLISINSPAPPSRLWGCIKKKQTAAVCITLKIIKSGLVPDEVWKKWKTTRTCVISFIYLFFVCNNLMPRLGPVFNIVALMKLRNS